MSQNDVAVKKVRGAIKDRALYLALLYRSFSQVLPPDQVERLAREAIYEYGRIKGQKDAGKITPEESGWTNTCPRGQERSSSHASSRKKIAASSK